MSNSSLVNYTKISPNSTNPRNQKISKITIHHMAGNLTVEQCGNVFANAKAKASSNYGIGTDGRVGLYVEEKNRSWASSNATNDNMAVTIEVANDNTKTWHVSDVALQKCIDLCVDICQRNSIKKLNFTGDKNGNLTMHRYFAKTACPGDYLAGKFPYIADEVNKKLGTNTHSNEYKVKVTASLLNVRSGAGTNYKAVTTIKKNEVYTIVEEINGWGKLKSGAGWICLSYVVKL